jgi:cytoskeletal protein RodZ
MPENNNIKIFTAADIEKYWKGQLSKAEMNALEKAAMEDPFLADAIEGYKNSAATPDDIQQLHQKLQERISEKVKVVPIGSTKINPKTIWWLRVAAAIIIIGGLGVLTRQLFFNTEKNEMALVKEDNKAAAETQQQTSLAADDSATNLSVPAEVKKESETIEKAENTSVTKNRVKEEKIPEKEILTANETVTKKKESKEMTVVSDESIAPATAPLENAKAPLARSKADDKISNEGRELSEVVVAQKKESANAEYKNSGLINLNNRFHYRIVDAQNNPVPFANVSNTRDGVGTYTDMSGYFNLVSSDSLLEVKVKSLGFTSSTFKIYPLNSTPELVIKEDENYNASIRPKNLQVIKSVPKKDTAELEEPEVGWEFYNTYAINNLKIPDNIRDKNRGSNVELSFEVNQYGQPVNIKIVKTSECKVCDDAAIRLLKEGPKWKRKGKKAKTNIVVSVDQ